MFGVYVSSISTSLGWGGQGGNMTLTLVEDTKNDIVIPKHKQNEDGEWERDDVNGEPFTGNDALSPKVGSACYFKYGNFYFGGVFQRWSYEESVSSGRTYSIRLETPSKLMDNVQIILAEFSGMTDYYISNWHDPAMGGPPVAGIDYSTNVVHPEGSAFGTFKDPRAFVNYENIANIYNVFGFYENALDGYFGGSEYNSAGMKVSQIAFALDILAKRDTLNLGGGPIKFADTDYSLNITELKDEIENVWGPVVDLGIAPDNDPLERDGRRIYTSDNKCYRISGNVVSVNSFVSDVVETLQLDYYYGLRHSSYLDPKVDGNPPLDDQFDDGGGLIDEADIVVRVISKQKPPEPNQVREYIKELKNQPDDQKKLISYNVGQEFSNAVTQKMVIGGDRTRYSVEQATTAWPVWGKREYTMNNGLQDNPYMIEPGRTGTALGIFGGGAGGPKTNWNRSVNINLGRDLGNIGYRATIMEIRMALEDKETWEIFKTFETTAKVEKNGNIMGYDTNDYFDCPWSAQFDPTKDLIQLLLDGHSLINLRATNTRFGRKAAINERNQVSDKIFQAVSNVANNFYCQQFLIPLRLDEIERGNEYGKGPTGIAVPQRLWYAPEDQFTVWKSWEVSDSAFIENSKVLCKDLNFFDGEAKQKSMTAWMPNLGGLTNPQYDFSTLGSDYAVGSNLLAGKIVSHKGSPEKEQYFNEPTAPHPRWWVLFKTGAQVRHFDPITTPDFGLTVLAKYFFNIDIPPAYYIKPGKQSLQFAIPPDVALPYRLGIPQQSTRLKYGPWINDYDITNPNDAFDGVVENMKGGAAVEIDEGLKPETFGGNAALNFIGVNTAFLGTQEMAAHESGTVELAGRPDDDIGTRFRNQGPYITNMDINIGTDGVKTTYKLNTWTTSFAKLAKYNVDRLANINKAQWTLAQKIRSRVQKRPFPKLKFEKSDFGALAGGRRFNQQDADVINFFLTQDVPVNVADKGVEGEAEEANANDADFGDNE